MRKLEIFDAEQFPDCRAQRICDFFSAASAQKHIENLPYNGSFIFFNDQLTVLQSETIRRFASIELAALHTLLVAPLNIS